jgi:putative endonuclease
MNEDVSKDQSMSWCTYVLLCKDGTFYTGITNDLDKRFQAHMDGTGAKYTRARGVKEIVYTKLHSSRSTASIHEAQIKKLSRKEKVLLIS